MVEHDFMNMSEVDSLKSIKEQLYKLNDKINDLQGDLYQIRKFVIKRRMVVE